MGKMLTLTMHLKSREMRLTISTMNLELLSRLMFMFELWINFGSCLELWMLFC